MKTDIVSYLNSLPDDKLILSIEQNDLTSLPDLTRFKNLKELYCGFNKLTSLPNNLPESLEILHCSFNKLTSLPDLINLKNLKKLYCSKNQLTSLPDTLPQVLEELICSDNQLTSLPNLSNLTQLKELNCSDNKLDSLPNSLPQSLVILYCFDNKINYFPNLPEKTIYIYYPNNPIYSILNENINNNSIIKVKKNIIIVNNFRYLYYSLKFKKQLRKWLWEIVRKKQIMEKYHPNHLIKNLEKDIDLEEFLNNW
jgi:Leucine-rich repeat (LRR) protein